MIWGNKLYLSKSVSPFAAVFFAVKAILLENLQFLCSCFSSFCSCFSSFFSSISSFCSCFLLFAAVFLLFAAVFLHFAAVFLLFAAVFFFMQLFFFFLQLFFCVLAVLFCVLEAVPAPEPQISPVRAIAAGAAIKKAIGVKGKNSLHRLNMALGPQIYLGSCVRVYSLAETPQPPPRPPAFGLTYEGAIGQPR